ncbi:MAG: hypothetical protein V4558_16050 [Gemmatimonadota bacterium]
MTAPRAAAALALTTLAGACHQTPPVMCTMEFRMVQVVAVTEAGVPVSGLTVRDSVLRTRHGFGVEQGSGLAPGGYLVFSDNERRELGGKRESVRVIGSDGGRGFAADFVFEADACHISKRSGPDTVIVR